MPAAAAARAAAGFDNDRGAPAAPAFGVLVAVGLRLSVTVRERFGAYAPLVASAPPDPAAPVFAARFGARGLVALVVRAPELDGLGLPAAADLPAAASLLCGFQIAILRHQRYEFAQPLLNLVLERSQLI